MHPVWNLSMLTIGAGLIAFGIQGITAHKGFLTGGVMGLGLLLWYGTGFFNAPVWNLLLNIPLYIFSWFNVSKRFFLYRMYGTVAIFFWGLLMDKVHVPVENDFYAAILAGVLAGAGGGIMLRTLGSSGGLDLVGVYINQKWNIPIGRFTFGFNALLFLVSATTIPLDLIIVSFIQVFISSSTLDYVLQMFNQRKMVFIITGKGQEVCYSIIETAGRATILPAYGGYSHESKEVVMTVTTNFTLRDLEDLVHEIDPDAFFAVENTFYVSGRQYPRKDR
jgi:uncharacterized membrane-anchored protein YitT (DUF2179 family)